MAINKKLNQLARERMKKTGESYTAARRQIMEAHAHDTGRKDGLVPDAASRWTAACSSMCAHCPNRDADPAAMGWAPDGAAVASRFELAPSRWGNPFRSFGIRVLGRDFALTMDAAGDFTLYVKYVDHEDHVECPDGTGWMETAWGYVNMKSGAVTVDSGSEGTGCDSGEENGGCDWLDLAVTPAAFGALTAELEADLRADATLLPQIRAAFDEREGRA